MRRRLAITLFSLSLSLSFSLGETAGAATAAPPSPTPTPAPTPAQLREVCRSGGVLNLRTAPSARARVVDVLPDEFDLLVLGTSGNWLKVRDESGRAGWVARQYTCAADAVDTDPGPWQSPAPGACVTSNFGPRTRPCGPCSRNHRGIDLGACGTAVLASASGRVLSAKFDRKGGNMVTIDHGGGLVSYYLHLKSSSVKPRQRVTAGTTVGIAGRTGTASTGCHLHFEVRKNGRPIDPKLLLTPSTRPPAG